MQLQTQKTYPTIIVEGDITYAAHNSQYVYLRDIAINKLPVGKSTKVNVIVVANKNDIANPSYIGVIEISKDVNGEIYESINSIGGFVGWIMSTIENGDNFIDDIWFDGVSKEIDSGGVTNLSPPVENPPVFTVPVVDNFGVAHSTNIASILPENWSAGKGKTTNLPYPYDGQEYILVGMSYSGFFASGVNWLPYELKWEKAYSYAEKPRYYGLGSLTGTYSTPFYAPFLVSDAENGGLPCLRWFLDKGGDGLDRCVPRYNRPGIDNLLTGRDVTPIPQYRLDNPNSLVFGYGSTIWQNTAYREIKRSLPNLPYEEHTVYGEFEETFWRSDTYDFYFMQESDLSLRKYVPGLPVWRQPRKGTPLVPCLPSVVLIGGLFALAGGVIVHNIRLNMTNNSTDNLL